MELVDVLMTVEDGVAVITLNRPQALNTLTAAMRSSLRLALREAGSSPRVRVIVLTGAGRGFCAGADMGTLSTIQASGSDSAQSRGEPMPEVDFPEIDGLELKNALNGTWGFLQRVPKPIIAAINGPVAGVGFIIALHCDLRFAARDARFTTSFSKLGLVAEHGSAWLLPRLVGPVHAMDLLLSSRKFDGIEAERIGLVNRAYGTDELMPEVMQVARMLATTTSPRSLRIMKAQVWKALFQDYQESLEIADREMRASFLTEDFREGIAHFVEKRAPRFTGH